MTAAEQPMRKVEFAARRGVDKSRVSQWIKEGKIPPEALVGEGRHQQIIETVAVAALRKRLDLSQRVGNGLKTNLMLEAVETPGETIGDVLPSLPARANRDLTKPPQQTDPLDELFQRAKLEEIQRRNRIAAVDEAARLGRFVEAEVATKEMGQIAARTLALFESSLPDLATAVSGAFNLPQRDVLHAMRASFRDVRANRAADLRTTAESFPQLVTVEIAGDETGGEVDR